MAERKTIHWTQDYCVGMSAEFVFIPYKDGTPGFVAVEMAKIGDFQKLCRPNYDDWEHLEPSYQFTVTSDFKYGQNNEQTERFLVFMDHSYKPYQHMFTMAADGTACMTTLGSLGKKWGSHFENVANIGGVLNVAKNFVGDELHSF